MPLIGKPCPVCKGKGTVRRAVPLFTSGVPHNVPLQAEPPDQPSVLVVDVTCPTCRGSRYVSRLY
jgi:hypothetical protein